MVCLVLEPSVAGWKVQTNPLSYGGTPSTVFFIGLARHVQVKPYKSVPQRGRESSKSAFLIEQVFWLQRPFFKFGAIFHVTGWKGYYRLVGSQHVLWKRSQAQRREHSPWGKVFFHDVTAVCHKVGLQTGLTSEKSIFKGKIHNFIVR